MNDHVMNYQELLSQTTLPTKSQQKKFARDVLSFHSWYKHLDQLNGNRFVFFVDPENTPIVSNIRGNQRPYRFQHAETEIKREWLRNYGPINYAVFDLDFKPTIRINFRGAPVDILPQIIDSCSCILFNYCFQRFGPEEFAEIDIDDSNWELYNAITIHDGSFPFVKSSLERWRVNLHNERLHTDVRDFIAKALDTWEKAKALDNRKFPDLKINQTVPSYELSYLNFLRANERLKVENSIKSACRVDI